MLSWVSTRLVLLNQFLRTVWRICSMSFRWDPAISFFLQISGFEQVFDTCYDLLTGIGLGITAPPLVLRSIIVLVSTSQSEVKCCLTWNFFIASDISGVNVIFLPYANSPTESSVHICEVCRIRIFLKSGTSWRKSSPQNDSVSVQQVIKSGVIYLIVCVADDISRRIFTGRCITP